MSDELKNFRYYADRAEWLLSAEKFDGKPLSHQTVIVEMAKVYAELAKAAPKAEPNTLIRCPEWLSQGNRSLPRGFIDYQCVLFAGHGTEHESSRGQYWIAEAGTSE
jgi:hypothetical protein